MFPGLHETEIGDEYPVLETSLENGFPLFHLDLFVVDYQIDHTYFCFNLIRYTRQWRWRWSWISCLPIFSQELARQWVPAPAVKP